MGSDIPFKEYRKNNDSFCCYRCKVGIDADYVTHMAYNTEQKIFAFFTQSTSKITIKTEISIGVEGSAEHSIGVKGSAGLEKTVQKGEYLIRAMEYE